LSSRTAVSQGESALLALSVFAFSEMLSVIIRYFTWGSYSSWLAMIVVETLTVWWMLPFLIAYKVERRDARSLGLVVDRERYLRYSAYAAVGLVLPVFLVQADASLLIEFAEQVVYIGLAEEFFYRGYLLSRFCRWLGDLRGLFLTSLTFGLGHFVSRLSEKGLGYIDVAGLVALQTFLGGLLLGYIFLRARNIWPGAILHVSGNMYSTRIIELFSGLGI